MKRSTATFIPYNLRPAKQAERRILLDFLKCANEVGLTISDCRYVGMGGTMFYDFHLIHRFLGISRMVSLERDTDIHVRCEFNRPFDFINIENKTAADFLAADKDERPTIYWFDYDDGFGAEIVADIISLGTRVTLGGFAFVTVCAAVPGVLGKKTKQQRLEHFQNDIGDFAGGLTADDMENGVFPEAIRKVLVKAFQNAFSARTDGKFQTLFQIQYKDSIPMITIGGCFSNEADAPDIVERVQTDLPFLKLGKLYQLKQLNLTTRERELFDVAVTKPHNKSKQKNLLRSLGFTDGDFEIYRDLLRFTPRYYESII